MASFSQDNKWTEAKRAVGSTNWIEVVSYYRSIDGENVFVYSVVDGEKRLIVDVLDDENVLLIGRDGNLITDSYSNVENSRKVFKYSDNNEQRYLQLGSAEYLVTIESHK